MTRGRGNGKREREDSIQRERVELVQRVVVTKVPRMVGLQTATIVLIVTNPSPGRLEEPRCYHPRPAQCDVRSQGNEV